MRLKLALLIPLLFAASAEAAGPKEIFVNSAGLELLGGANRISLAPGFNWGFFDWLQAGASLGYQTVGFGDDSVNTTTLQFGPTFNLGGPYATATFIFAGYAIRKGNGTVSDLENDPAGSGFSMLVGRRIPVLNAFGFRPSVGLQMAGKTTFVLNVLAISYLF